MDKYDLTKYHLWIEANINAVSIFTRKTILSSLKKGMVGQMEKVGKWNTINT